MQFWKGYADVKSRAQQAGEFEPCDDILMLEGHRPIRRYVSEFGRNGLNRHTKQVSELRQDGILESNPLQLVEGSSILNTLVMEKDRS